MRLPRSDFPRDSRGLERRSSPHFSVLYIASGRGYAIVIPKKLHKRAVDRHRLKRRIIGALTRPPPLTLPEAFILYPKTGALELDAPHMRAELAALLTSQTP